jgi:lysozyme
VNRRGPILAGLAGLAVGGVLLWRTGLHPPAPDPRLYPVHGVDVSHHQGLVTWGRLPGQGVRFAYLKASEGGDLRDPMFRAGARQAHETGLAVGAYHYFTLCRPGAAQAANFLDAIEGAPTDLPPAIDLEHKGNCRNGAAPQPFERELGVFIDMVERRTGRSPILYTTREFYDGYLASSRFRGEPIWMRDLLGGTDTAPGAHVVMRQFASNGRLDGIDGRVDLDAFMGSQAAFAALRGPSGRPGSDRR